MLPIISLRLDDLVHEVDGILEGTVVAISAHRIAVKCTDGLTHYFHPSELVRLQSWKVTGSASPASIARQKGDLPPRKHASRMRRLDLHLTENDSGHRALERQLSLLRNALSASGWDKITVIHGVGEGILKNAVHEVVRKETPYRLGSSTDSETEVWRV